MSLISNLILALGMVGLTAAIEYSSSFAMAARSEVQAPRSELKPQPMLLAKEGNADKGDKKAKKPAGKGVRERFITREAQVKKRQRNIDFEAVDISGERKTPFGSLVDQNKSNKDFDLIKIRMRWHPEMIQSTTSLETGKAR